MFDSNEEDEEQDGQTNLAVTTSVTRYGDFLHFGRLFKAFGNN